jgi:large subunit ribosomal protein L29
MKARELREKTLEQLQEQLLELRREQFNLRIQQATGQQARSDQVTRVRRDIARLKTIVREREQQKQTA